MRVDMCTQRLGYRLQCTLIFLLYINGCDSGSVLDLGAMNISTTFNLAASTTFYETSFETTHFMSTQLSQHMEKEESEEDDVSPQQVLLECMESLSPLSHLYCIIALSAVLCFVLLFVLSLIYCCLIRPRLKRQKAYRMDHNPKKRGMKQQQLNSDMDRDRDMKRSIFMDALSDVMPSTQKIQHVQTNTFNGSEIQALTQMHTQLNHTSDQESPSCSIEMGMAGKAAAANNGHGAVHMSGMDQDELDMEARRYTVTGDTGDYGYDYDRPADQDSEDTHENDRQSPDRNHQTQPIQPTQEAQNKEINLFHLDI